MQMKRYVPAIAEASKAVSPESEATVSEGIDDESLGNCHQGQREQYLKHAHIMHKHIYTFTNIHGRKISITTTNKRPKNEDITFLKQLFNTMKCFLFLCISKIS